MPGLATAAACRSNFHVIDGNDAKPRETAIKWHKEGITSYVDAWNKIQVGEKKKARNRTRVKETGAACVGSGFAEGCRNTQESRKHWTAF